VGEICVPVSPPSDQTLAVKLEVIQDQMKQLTEEKAKSRSTSPVCFAGCSDSRRESLRSDSRPGSPRRVHFDRSAVRGVQEYRNAQDDLHDDRHTRSEEHQSSNNWDNKGQSKQWNTGLPNCEFRDRFRGSGGCEF